MLGREVIECQQRPAILAQAFGGLVVLDCEIASNCDPLPRLKHLIDYS